MEVESGDDDNRSFKANFTADGVSNLRNKIGDKLKEFMGDYTDDTLVEYVIVLLKNGRSKAEAKNELNVFLGDDSDSFVSWLWDHLGFNLHLYVHPCNEVSEIKPPSQNHVVTNDSEKAQPAKLHRSRHNREWRSLVRDEEAPPPFKSTVIDKVHLDETTPHKVTHALHSTSPQKLTEKKINRPKEVLQKKRNRLEEESQAKRVITSQGNTGAARRLLQFAVKEAMATTKPSISTSEPKLKRLRSVVSMSAAGSSVENRPRRRLQSSLVCVPNAMSTAMKAVEEAVKDVPRSSFSGNVFDRLGHRRTEFDESLVEEVDYGVFKENFETRPMSYEDVSMLENDTHLASDYVSDNEGYDQVNVSTSGGYKGEVDYSVDRDGEKIMQKPRKEQDRSVTDVGTSSKVLNISVNVNTWKPPHYQEQGVIQQVPNRKTVQNIETSTWMTKEKMNAVFVNGNTKPAADIPKESTKIPSANHGLYTTGRPTDDVDSRTVFVSNVHFAATKDGLSRHFNKFGEVLKVTIMTDAATGQPKGSAYVEFMRKEAADNALSLDGTSFMSRILKIVNKSSASQDTAPTMSWPRAIRGSPFAPTARFGRGFFPRGSYNARPLMKARSLQWKREEAKTAPSEDVNSTNNNSAMPSISLGNRSLTYVRAEQNTNGQSATSS